AHSVPATPVGRFVKPSYGNSRVGRSRGGRQDRAGAPVGRPPARLRRKGRTQNDPGAHGGPGPEAAERPPFTGLLRLLAPAARVYPVALFGDRPLAGNRKSLVADMTVNPQW